MLVANQRFQLRRLAFVCLLGASLPASAQRAWHTTPTFPYGPKMGIAATGDSTLLTAVAAGVLCTNNQGHTWRLALRTHQAGPLYATRRGQLLVGGIGQVYRSPDQGATWDSVALATPYPITCFAETAQGELLVGTGTYTPTSSEGSGVFYSADYGHSWHARNTSFGKGRYVNHLAVDRQDRVYAAIADEDPDHMPGLYMSANKGQHWLYLPFSLPASNIFSDRRVLAYEITALAVSPQDSLQCSFSGGAYPVAVRGNFAKSLAELDNPRVPWTVHGGTTRRLWWDRVPLAPLYFAASGDWYSSRTGLSGTGGTLVSQDYGQTWQLTTNGLGLGAGGQYETQQIAATTDGKLFMVQNTDERVYWTTTGTVTTNRPSQASAPLHLFPNPATTAVQVANETGQAIRTITLTDVHGRLVRQLVPAAHERSPTLPLHGLSAGVYVAMFTLANAQVVRQRVVKQ